MRLAEAKRYAGQALAIRETLDASSKIWSTLSILGDIADLEGRAEEARDYRRREREVFAAFEGNRYHIDRQHGQLIAVIAAAAQGDTQAQAKVEAALPELEKHGWHIVDATRRIWAGERDWHSLVEDLDSQDALLILRVLETIAQPEGETAKPAPEEAELPSPEQVFAALPAAIQEAMARGDQAAFEQAMGTLAPEEQQFVIAAIRYLQEQTGEASEGEE